MDTLAGENLRHDYARTTLRYDLKQRRQGYALLAALQQVSGVEREVADVYRAVCAGLTTELGMDRALVLTPAEAPGTFRVAASTGIARVAEDRLRAAVLTVPPEMHADSGVLVNKAAPPGPAVATLAEALGLPFLVALPVLEDGAVVCVLLAGRLREAPPFSPPLGEADVDTLRVVAGLVAASQRDRQFATLRAEHERRTVEVEKAREIEAAYTQLKATQAQVVQQEKLASLGALTAGIAHEIKNPLNFVNNFAQLSEELVAEIKDERASSPELRVADIEDVLDDLSANVRRIREHGQRADSIVKNMLAHSRGGAGAKEAVDVNALLDEYTSLAFHGMRAQRPDFTCTVERSLDAAAGSVEAVPQDLSRVVLNLVGNALYAVAGRAKQAGGGDAPEGYAPTVRVSTHAMGEAVEVRVWDNGGGIPEAVRAKIFEPFFTTKPAGEGTGLGLSLSHDIVAAHGGTLAVESDAGETTFTLTLPTEQTSKVSKTFEV